jgi:ElaB/YqjD/DUF883 family membrane-anchored ribosome-binding protein
LFVNQSGSNQDVVFNILYDLKQSLLKEATMQAIDKLTNAAEQTADKIADAASQANEALEEKAEQFIKLEQKCMKNCRASIRDYPIMSVGIAVAAGFILSQLTRTCNHKNR